jgi:hypothetical protein
MRMLSQSVFGGYNIFIADDLLLFLKGIYFVSSVDLPIISLRMFRICVVRPVFDFFKIQVP